MASRRLSQYNRDRIIDNIIDKRFSDRHKAAKIEENNLALLCYRKCVTQSMETSLKQLPEGWISYSKTLRFNIGGMNYELEAFDKYPVPDTWGTRIGNISDEAIYRAAISLHELKETLEVEIRKTKSTLKEFLSSFNTVDQMLKTWPEGEPFYSEVVKASNSDRLVPTVRTEDVNSLLGITNVH